MLCLHLHRLGYGLDGTQRKDRCHITFPPLLDVGPLCWPRPAAWHQRIGAPAVPLRLVAAIVHLGGATSGHFITYRQVAPPAGAPPSAAPQWVCISDDEVRPVPASQVYSCEAYILFYSRM